jgi:putative membrane protein
MLTDLLLAIAHHLLIFILFAILAVELVWLKRDITREGLSRLAKVDMAFGIVAGLIIIVGVSRVFFGLKGYEYYVESHSFWAKMVAFLIVALLSIKPTLAILAWNRRAAREPGFLPTAAEISGIRRYLHVEATIFLLIPIFAAAMARGY